MRRCLLGLVATACVACVEREPVRCTMPSDTTHPSGPAAVVTHVVPSGR